MLGYLAPPLPFILFLLNGLGEAATGIKWLLIPERQIEGANGPFVSFLFRAWALSIIGFGVASLAIAFKGCYDTDEGTSAFCAGAVVYHAGIASLYIRELSRKTLRPVKDWQIGALLHLIALLCFVIL